MNASSPLTTAVQVALAISLAFAARYLLGWSLVLCVLSGVIASYPLTMVLVAVGGLLARDRPSD